MTLPAMPAGLTADWLTEALSHAGLLEAPAVVTQVLREQVGEGVGMMSELARLQLTYSTAAGDAPASVIAKFPSQNPTNRAVAMSYNLYEREVRFFLELNPHTTAASPQIYTAALDGDNFIILMEDLADYRVGNQIDGADLQETELAVDELAKLHGAFWNRVQDIQWVPHIANSYHADNMVNLTEVGWPAMVTAFDAFIPDPIASLGERFQRALPDLQARMDTPPITLLHGDFRMENFLYGTRATHHPMVLIDWQGPLLGRGLVDLALLLCQSTQTEVRRAHEPALLQRYLDGLVRLGVQLPSFDQSWQDYRATVLYNWCYVAVVAGTLDPSNARGFAWMSQMVARQCAASQDLQVFDLLP